MHPKVCIAVAALIVITITPIEADRELNFHCTDYIREMLQDGCMHLQRYLRQKMDSKMKLDESKKKSNVGRSKRDMDNLTEYSNEAENEMDTEIFNFRLQYVKNESQETFLKGHRLYNVRHSKYPDGAHLILNHYSAKMLREYDSNFHIEPRSSVYRNVNGKLVKDNSFRHRRSPNHFIERLAACCESDTECLFAFCFAGS